MDILPKILKVGDELVTAWLNAIRALVIKAQLRTGEGSGIALNPTEHGTYIALAPVSASAQLAITDGSITARSGTTAGTGNVFLVTSSVVSGVCTLTSGSVDLPVFNFSSTTGGIANGVYVWIEQDPYGTWWITAVDCGN